MKTINNERVICCDIDDTLVMHDLYSEGDPVVVDDPVSPGEITVIKNHPMIRLVEEELARGSFIVFWSRGGFQWAENVVKALGIEHKNVLFMTKPYAYFDDKDVSDWLKDRVYLNPYTPYKNK